MAAFFFDGERFSLMTRDDAFSSNLEPPIRRAIFCPACVRKGTHPVPEKANDCCASFVDEMHPTRWGRAFYAFQEPFAP